MASIIKADNIQKVSDGSNIIKKCGSTITLGSCGATISLAAGATQTGFGRTGTVDWCTTAKTAPFTGVSGKGYFVNTTCGAVTVTLPATPSAGDIISVKDYAGTWQTNSLTICRNGSKIAGGCAINPLLTSKNESVTLIYVDATQGWLVTSDTTSSISSAEFYITATGGTITTCGDYKIHTFTSDGTFCISAGQGSLAKVDYLIVAGGSGGGYSTGGGGGAGGYRESKCATTSGCWTASPLASATSLGPFTPGAYPITVGAGGAEGNGGGCASTGTNGSNSIFSSITSTGGGGGGGGAYPVDNPGMDGQPGGSGGGGSSGGGTSYNNPGGTGNTPPTSPSQGFPGGQSSGPPGRGAGGGGGAVAAGESMGPPSTNGGGNGGSGATSSINATPTARAGGGGGGAPGAPGNGGTGGGGAGGVGAPAGTTGTAGTVNTGGGGGGGGDNAAGGAGGSGVVIIRYKFQ